MEYYLAIKKVRNSAICSHMERSRDCHIEWSKPEREKQISCNIDYMCNLEKDTIQLTYKIEIIIDVENKSLNSSCIILS